MPSGASLVADARPERRWLFHALGALLLALAVFSLLSGYPWFDSLLLLCGATIFFFGRRRLILRAGVRRSGEEIVCRYLPLYEGNTYYFCILMPAMGIATIAAGMTADHAGWIRYGGILILAISALMTYGSLRMWRLCLVRVTTTTLSVRGSYIGRTNSVIDIQRDHIKSIESTRVTRGDWLQVEITYRVDGAEASTDTIRLGPEGPQVSVQPMSLFNALTVWEDGAEADPTELMDRVQQILRDRSTAADA